MSEREASERESTFAWPKTGDLAFKIAARGEGANINQDDLGRHIMMVVGYKEAADHLVNRSVEQPHSRDALIFPVIFNYRQFLELNIKFLIANYGPGVGIRPDWTSHDLQTLWHKLQRLFSAYGVHDPDQTESVVADVIGEFAKVDPGSFSFRYPVNRSGDLIPIALDEVDLCHLRRTMDKIYHFFSGSDGYLDHLSKCAP